MLSDLATMVNGHLGRMNITKHRIELSPADAKLRQYETHEPSPRARKFEENEVDKMLSEGGIEPAQSEWAVAIMFRVEQRCFFVFCLENRKLNAFASRTSTRYYAYTNVSIYSAIAQSSLLWMQTAGTGKSRSKKKIETKTAYTSPRTLPLCSDATLITECSKYVSKNYGCCTFTS